MASDFEGFLRLACDEALAGQLRAEVAAAAGVGYGHFDLNAFEIELFHAEGRVTIVDVAALGYDDAELPLADFLAALPDVPPGPRMSRSPRRVIVPPPP